jgi:RsiW-degrading membrane proteinase PrsW (M82 family)
MIIREKPTPISWLQALTPVGFGMASTMLSFYVLIGLSVLLNALNLTLGDVHPFVRSLYLGFLMAGGPEEITKFAFILITVFLFRKKIRNVYEYILIGAAVGIGFTLPEEFGYGEETQASLFRLMTLAGHMVYGIIMGKHLGIARYNKLNEKPRFLQYVLSLMIPILLHSLYDACTSGNLMILSEDSALQDQGINFGLIAVGVHFIAQFIILYLVKKNTQKYCDMVFAEVQQTAEPKQNTKTEETEIKDQGE